jgi:hypothetical protein
MMTKKTFKSDPNLPSIYQGTLGGRVSLEMRALRTFARQLRYFSDELLNSPVQLACFLLSNGGAHLVVTDARYAELGIPGGTRRSMKPVSRTTVRVLRRISQRQLDPYVHHSRLGRDRWHDFRPDFAPLGLYIWPCGPNGNGAEVCEMGDSIEARIVLVEAKKMSESAAIDGNVYENEVRQRIALARAEKVQRRGGVA